MMAYFTKEINPSLVKLPLNFNGGLAKLGLTSLVKQDWSLSYSVTVYHKPSFIGKH